MEQITKLIKVYRCRGCRKRVNAAEEPEKCHICGSTAWEYLFAVRAK